MNDVSEMTMDTAAQDRDALMERLLESAVSTFNIHAVHLGTQMGFYDVLAEGPVTVAELADKTDTHVRYVREWLEHQTVTGVVRVENPDDALGCAAFHAPGRPSRST